MKTLLTLTLSGSALALLLMALRYFVLRRMPSTVYYYAWALVLLRFAMPLPGLVPAAVETSPPASLEYSNAYLPDADEQMPELLMPGPLPGVTPVVPSDSKKPIQTTQAPEMVETQEKTTSAKPSFSIHWRSLTLWLWVWALGTALSFGLTVVAYLRFTIHLRHELHRPDRFTRAIYASIPGQKPGLWMSDTIRTPLMYGLFSPRIVLPERDYDEELLRNILSHELMHFRRFDTLYKWAAAAILSAHWFNPLCWLIRREINRSCELSCDEMLLGSMSREEKRSYGNTLLAMAASSLPAGVVATTFSTEKRNLKERLEQIMHYKKSKSRLLAAVLTLALLAGCGVAAGPLASPSAAEEKATDPAPIPEGAVRVTNVDEFLAAIAPNTTIYLEPGEYDLTAASDYGKDSASEWYSWEKVWDEGSDIAAELVIRGVEGLRIIGAGLKQTTVAAVPRHANVLRFVNCRHLTVSNLTAGHTVEPGFCSGGVLRIEGCTNIIVETCGLYGCGTVGVDATDTNNLTVTGCHIYECSSNAVSLQQCHGVRVEDCDVYGHGTRLGQNPAYSLFTASFSNDVVFYHNRIHENASQFLLQLQYTQNASFLSNEVHDNRFDAGVFQFEQYGATVDGCSFTDNDTRIWVQSSGVYANDATGKLLGPEDYESMTLRDMNPDAAYPTPMPMASSADVRPGGSVEVSTVDEFLTAIGPNRTIILDGELFDLSEAGSYGAVGGEYYYWQQSFDGPELVIQNVSGLTIHAKAAYPEATTLAAIPRYANVLSFRNCDDLRLVGFTAGHTKEPGSCSGGVLNFQSCHNVRLDCMVLYGCGILGVQASNSTSLDIWRTEIYECSQGAAQFFQCDGVRFDNCNIHDVPSPAFSFMECGDVSWNGQPVTSRAEKYNVDDEGSLSSATNEDPAQQYETALFTYPEEAPERMFASSVQKAIADGDWEALADQVKYPLQIIGEDYYVRILNREQFLEAADSVFNLVNPDFREIIASAALDEFGVTIYGMTFCDHRIAFISYLMNTDEPLFGVSAISLSAPIWPTFAYGFLNPAPTPQP